MAGLSAQDIQEQVRQAQQHALAPTVSQQQPLPPIGAGGGYVPPPPVLPLPPLPSPNASSLGGGSSIVNMGKISLLSICFSLVFFGAFSFLGGFLLGMWFGGPEPISFSSNERKETRLLGQLPPEQPMPVSQTAPTSSQDQLIPPWFAEKAGAATEDTIKNATIRGVPDFLAPLVSATQSAVGKQMGYKVQQQMGDRSNQSTSSPPQRPLSTSHAETTLPHQQPQTSQLPTSEFTRFPVVTLQKEQSPPSLSFEDSRSLSHSKDEGYTIQLGVYAAADNAYALVNHMQTLNHTSHVVEGKSSDGSALYYVHSGLYNDYNAALGAASQFASQNIPGATIVRVSRKDKGAS